MRHKDRLAAVKYRSFDYDVKAVGDDGLFSGYGSVFGVVDSYNEVVAPGAFLESIEEAKAKSRTFRSFGSTEPASPSVVGISAA